MPAEAVLAAAAPCLVLDADGCGLAGLPASAHCAAQLPLPQEAQWCQIPSVGSASWTGVLCQRDVLVQDRLHACALHPAATLAQQHVSDSRTGGLKLPGGA